MIDSRLSVVRSDITAFAVDAIVNAANSSLMGGGGVDGAIHRAGGPAILKACKKIVAKQGACKTGEAVITTAGNLPAKFVIHTVGPVWQGGHSGERELLKACYRNSLQLAVANGCRSVSFPAISTGVYGFPKAEAADIAVQTVWDFLRADQSLERVNLVCYDEEHFRLVLDTLNQSAKT